MNDEIYTDYGTCQICDMDKTVILIDPVNRVMACADCLFEIYKAWNEGDTDLLNSIGSDEEVM